MEGWIWRGDRDGEGDIYVWRWWETEIAER
jgi:hypothetical protein